MSDVSGRIWNEVMRAIHADPRTGSIEERVAYRDGNAAKATDRIIELVREALMAHDAVGRAIIAHREAEHESPMAAAITDALDAAGLGGDGHE